jgi:hypothetical protein
MARGRKLESLKDYQRALKNKYGIGQGIDYKPWLKIDDVKSHGTKSLIFGRKTNRDHHMLSGIESEHFFLAEFSDRVVDIREQFPILPLNYTQKIAKTLGVAHPKHPKTKEHIILTTDQLLTLDGPEGNSFHAVSVKPKSESGKLRVLEKIEIERVCWELLGVNFSYFTGNELTKYQSQNIQWATSPFRDNPLIFSQEQVDCALSCINLGQCFVEELCNQLILLNVVSNEEALSLIRFLIANKHINVDLTFNIPESGILNVKSMNIDQRRIVNGVL